MDRTLSPVESAGFEVADAGDADAAWDVLTFELTERICEPYSLMLSLATTKTSVPVHALVGKRCSFGFERDDFRRDIHGVVVKTETIGVVADKLRIRVWIAPFLQLLDLSRRTRAFHGKNAIEILRTLVEPLRKGKDNVGIDTTGIDQYSFRTRDLCVQFDETDLAFAQRLLAEEGVTFSFRHDDDSGEVMVLMPMTAVFHSVAGVGDMDPKEVRMRTRALGLTNEETLRALEGSSRMRAARTAAAMWDWKGNPPSSRLAGEDPLDEDVALPPSAARLGETYLFETYRPTEESDGGALFEQSAGEANMQGHRHRIEDVRAVGAGDVVGFTDGATFEVTEHPTRDLEGRYVLLSVFHHCDFQIGEGREAPTYENRFTCFRFADADGENPYTYVPPRPDKPRAHGPMLATVVGPAGDEIHTDEFGRIRVRMHWDREGEASLCWVPVAQTWAGAGFGAVFVPRVGMEVVITFVAGDPDRPLCSGVVYNGQNMPPYAMPDHKTRSVLKTASSPGGDGFNELSFEDAAGSEEVFLHAQRNLREVVKKAHSTSVGASQRNTVGGNQTNHVHGDQRNTVEKDQAEAVKGDVTIEVDGDREEIVGGDEAVTIQGNRETTVVGSDTHTVSGAMREVYAGARSTTVTGGDTEVVATGDKSLSVAGGALSLRSNASAVVAGASHELKLKDGATLSTSGDFTITNGEKCSVASKGGTITVEGTEELTLRCGLSCIVLKADGKIEVNGASEVKLASGESTYTADPRSTTIQSDNITSTALAIQELKAALIKLN